MTDDNIKNLKKDLCELLMKYHISIMRIMPIRYRKLWIG